MLVQYASLTAYNNYLSVTTHQQLHSKLNAKINPNKQVTESCTRFYGKVWSSNTCRYLYTSLASPFKAFNITNNQFSYPCKDQVTAAYVPSEAKYSVPWHQSDIQITYYEHYRNTELLLSCVYLYGCMCIKQAALQ